MESTNHFVPAKVPTVQDQVLVKEVPVVELQPVSNLGTEAIHASLYSIKTNNPIFHSLPQQRYPSQKRVERAADIRRLRQKTQEDSTEDDEVLKPVPTIEEPVPTIEEPVPTIEEVLTTSTVEVLPTYSEVLPVEPVPTIEVLSTDDSEDDDSEDDPEDDSEDDDSDEDEDETKRVHILEGVKFNSFPDYVVAKRKRNDKRLEDLGLGPSSSFANKRLKRKMDCKKRSYTAPATSNDSFCADFFGNDPTTTSQKLANCKSKMVDGMKAIKPKLIEEHPAVLGIVGNRVEDHAHKWFLEPMQFMVSGQPISEATTTDPDRKIALMVGNYPISTLSEKDNHKQGLWGMLEKVNTEGSDSEFRFKNPSMDQIRSNFGEIGPNESITCEEVEEMIVAVDVFPFQLFYRANVPKLLDILKKEYPEFYTLYITYSKLEFESIAHALKRAGQDPNQTPVFTLGSTPYDEITKSGRHLNFVADIFQSPGRTCHPCSLIDPTSTCGLKRFKESDETLTRVSRFITGDKNMNITFHQRFYENNIETVKAVLKRRSRTYFGGPDQSELSKRVQAEMQALWMFGGPDQCEASKKVQAEWRFGGPDQCELSKRVQAEWRFGGPDQCEESKQVQALWMFGGPDQCEASKKVQAEWRFGGPNQCEVSKKLQAEWTYDGPNQCEESKQVQAKWKFGGPYQCEESKQVQAAWMFGGKFCGPDQCEESKRIQAEWTYDGPDQCEESKKVQALWTFGSTNQCEASKKVQAEWRFGGPNQCEVSKKLQAEWTYDGPNQCEESKKVQAKWTYDGPNQCEESKRLQGLWMFGSTNQCEASKRAQAAGRLNEKLWDDNLKRAVRYAATSGPIPFSLPTRLQGRVLSENEKFEKVNIHWIKRQRMRYSRGYSESCRKNAPMGDEQRKIKFQASGLLDQCEVSTNNHSCHFPKDEKLWDDNLKRAVRYAAASGPLPLSLPKRLRFKGRVLSKDDANIKVNLSWILTQRRAYSSGWNNKPMEEGRKIKFLASGLL